MECEHRGFVEHEMALLQGLEVTAVNYDTDKGFGAATKRIAAMRIAEANGAALLDFQRGTRTDHEADNATFVCLWCLCAGSGAVAIA